MAAYLLLLFVVVAAGVYHVSFSFSLLLGGLKDISVCLWQEGKGLWSYVVCTSFFFFFGCCGKWDDEMK